MAVRSCKAFDRVLLAGLLHKLTSYGISDQIFGLISAFLSNKRLRVALNGKSSQEYPVNSGVPQGSMLGPTFFLLYSNDLSDCVICNVTIYVDGTTLYSWFCLTGLITLGLLMWKWIGLLLIKDHLLSCWRCFFFFFFFEIKLGLSHCLYC